MNSTRQNPLLGASKITLQLQDNLLVAEAELGSVERMQRFLKRFPLILGLSLGLFFGIGGGFLFGQQFGVGFGVPWAKGWQWLLVAVSGAVLPVAPWLVLSPLMAKSIRIRTQHAIETLVRRASFTAMPAHSR